MAHLDATSAECLVLTFKEGLLSAVAHDLQIRVGTFTIDVDDTTHAITARFDPASLKVIGAVQDGAVREGALSDADKQKIEHTIADEVLAVRAFPDIRFTSTQVQPEGEGFRVWGELTLHGRTKAIVFPVHRRADRYVAEVTIHQPDFGIKPYSALLGALKIKPDVTVRCSAPAG